MDRLVVKCIPRDILCTRLHWHHRQSLSSFQTDSFCCLHLNSWAGVLIYVTVYAMVPNMTSITWQADGLHHGSSRFC